ncbi:MAG: Superoxide dismutase [Fe] [Chlamydiae bacterium]|nr:Superoxide dismutase [Fe] [Chlamydiota bacterium]
MKIFWILLLFLVGTIEASPFRPSPIPVLETQMEFKEKDFSHLLGRLPGLSDSLLKMHFTLYAGYVKNTNALAVALSEMREDKSDRSIAYGALKRRFAWEFDGMYLHELYFGNLGGKTPLNSKSSLYKKIVSNYGSYEAWERNFKATGLIRGIGWVILYLDPIGGFINNIWVDEHNINHLPGGTPLLIMDVWEHAYITEFGLNRGRYIDVFFDNIDWSVVQKRFELSNLR